MNNQADIPFSSIQIQQGIRMIDLITPAPDAVSLVQHKRRVASRTEQSADALRDVAEWKREHTFEIPTLAGSGFMARRNRLSESTNFALGIITMNQRITESIKIRLLLG